MTDPNTSWAQPEGTAPQPVPVAPVTPVASSPAPVATPKKKSGGFTNALLVIAALVAVGGVTFAIGRATAPASGGERRRERRGPGRSWARRELRSRHHAGRCGPRRASAPGR